ncbi:hypothetical protein TraAM80_00233 [Trypanosoma rangeli]|uniref:Histone RNA hairpin-binding protein RNA-binding domain-containing protein n=1 Tax=Trypanosoma rangeli TaxID=5698 RepID=A0A422P4P1_TRYRA|nr:uncharacterized protein TraAM80_00233 [Trypanosoma rangeli]RNF12683.1 hypothetical protein TraAM80_00233 [Trypanosoma rangeli]|eukprot:RNF12683.1 hypothetical protein TraAM80_00233 [Trypanosoma rangeli]
MLPVPAGESSKRPGSRNNIVSSGGGNGGAAPVWEGSAGRGSPKADLATSATPTRNVPAAAAQQMRSPIVKTHQPYREVPLFMFGVESELEGYAGVNMENLVTVKAAYKADIARTSGPSAAGVSSSFFRRSTQRSPIAALDGSDSQVGPIGRLCGTAVASAALQGTINSSGSNMAAAPVGVVAATCTAPARTGLNNKRMVSLDVTARAGGYGALTGAEMHRCPAAFQLVEKEEKHLNYTGVELLQSEINLGDTAERSRRLKQRQRQVQYGKETAGYSNYLRAVPSRCDREFRNPMHPMTPRPEYDCSKRTFDRYLNMWRRQLHLWDEYDPNNLEPQYVRIGIPTLRSLGLEPSPSTPEFHQNPTLSFTPMNAQGLASMCTPVMPRHIRRDVSISMGSYQRSAGYQQGAGGAVAAVAAGAPSASSGVPPHARPLSGCGGGSWSITNTPHTPYHGSTHSTSSYQPPLLSVLAQPTIYSPHWGDSSRQSSPNPHAGQRNSGYVYHNLGGGVAPTTTAAGGGGAGGGGAAPPAGPGNAVYWEGGGVYHGNTNNNTGYAYHGYSSPYGGHRYTPHTTSNHYYPYYAGNATGGGAGGGGGGGNLSSPPPLCSGQEVWGNPPRQMHQ